MMGKTYMGVSSIAELNAFMMSTLPSADFCYWQVMKTGPESNIQELMCIVPNVISGSVVYFTPSATKEG